MSILEFNILNSSITEFIAAIITKSQIIKIGDFVYDRRLTLDAYIYNSAVLVYFFEINDVEVLSTYEETPVLLVFN